MTDDQRTIEDYAGEFERHLAGSAEERAWMRAELVEHLSDAADAGELAEALRRLGSPESAAEAFARDRSARPASLPARWGAALIDNVPLVGVTVALLVQGVARSTGEGGSFSVAFPPLVSVRVGDACVALAPFQCGQTVYEGAGLLYSMGVPLAVAWSILGLGLLEALTGSTPGKRHRGLRVVTENGLRVPVAIGVVRRLSFLAGPFAWLDWIPVLWGGRGRVLDLVAGTKVVIVDPAKGRPQRDPDRR